MWINRMRSLIGCGVALGAASIAHAGEQLPATQWWIERPWEFRYFINIETVQHMKWGIKYWQEKSQLTCLISSDHSFLENGLRFGG